ncbi:hypothetical protein SLEP1_g48057 [Rubroshorea leprosula]|uniref:Uncharacterized protein n=1 Tax=Rubroshorea leprosula TaxID=152421 RepID=A0AAV5LSF9_9ROSI|nr:hypothetical protein SLEP1_g48057 [Rubroshorea leprosula]
MMSFERTVIHLATAMVAKEDPQMGQLLKTGRKQPTLSFTSSHSLSAASFDLVHSDIWGPSSIPTMGSSSGSDANTFDELHDVSPHAPPGSIEDVLHAGNVLDNIESSSLTSSISPIGSNPVDLESENEILNPP